MKLIFFDEAKDDQSFPHYHLGAVCIDESFLAGVEAKIQVLSEEAFKTSELSAATEFHAAEIYHRKTNTDQLQSTLSRSIRRGDCVHVFL